MRSTRSTVYPGPVPRPTRGIYLLRASDGFSASVVQYAIPVLTYQLTGSLAWAGAAFAAEWTPRIAGLVIGGTICDRFPARFIIASAAIVRSLVLVAGAALLSAGGGGAAVVVVLGGACGLVAQISYLSAETLWGADPKRCAEQVQSRQAAIDQAVLVTGPMAGSALALAGSVTAVNSAALLTLVVPVIAAVAIVPPRKRRKSRDPVKRPGLRVGRTALRSAPSLCWIAAVLASMNLLGAILTAALPGKVAEIGHSPVAAGAIWTVAALSALITALLGARLLRCIGPAKVITVSSLMAAFAAASVGFAGSYGQVLGAMAVLGAAEGAALVAMRTVRARLLPPVAFGSAVAVMILILLAPMPLGGLVLMAAGDQHLTLVLVAVATGHLMLTCLTAPVLRRHRASLTNTNHGSTA